ncbi:MAG: histidinol dehydrogenase, partial [Actinomycetota bacterium]|nr:histidinol dehydrogenase [Actinomycetota bacterium]
PDKSGEISKYTLAAAAVIGIDEIYRVGGAQAIAAMAYGTATIKRVDKITGPGNIYVATAKKFVVGAVDIDMIAGPTEVVIVADGQARPDFIAADMIAQAEHDPLSTAILLTDDEALAEAVVIALESQLKGAGREKIARRALDDRGRIFILDGLETRPQTGFSAASLGLAVEFINRFAPEHLEIMTLGADDWLPRIRNAGAIFLGSYTPEAVGDYVAGTNHVLPTGSTARFYSPLGVYDFIKWSSVLSFTKAGLMKLGSHAVCLADAEGLEGHGRSVNLRLDDE